MKMDERGGRLDGLTPPRDVERELGEPAQEALRLRRELLVDEAAKGSFTRSSADREERSPELRIERQTLINEFKVEVVDGRRCSITLPAGVTPLDLLRRAQAAGPHIDEYYLTWPSRLEKFAQLDEFNVSSDHTIRIVVNVLPENMTFKTRAEQEAECSRLGVRLATLSEVATVFAGYFLLTGSDFFSGHIVRVDGGKLYYGSGGLSMMDPGDFIDECRYSIVTAALCEKREHQ